MSASLWQPPHKSESRLLSKIQALEDTTHKQQIDLQARVREIQQLQARVQDQRVEIERLRWQAPWEPLESFHLIS